jgi:membrane-associated protease RseP (regulator of RpoE activity)
VQHAVDYTIYAVLVFVLLLVSVAIHEFGHLLTAKHYGMKATEYFVGFGPRIFSFRRGETEYGLKAIPAGGYVKIIGMSPLENHDGTKTPEDIEAAAAAMSSLPTDMERDAERNFYTFPARQRSVVLAAGSLTHFVLTIVLVFAALLIDGDPFATPQGSLTLASVEQCVNTDAAGNCPPGAPKSPAVQAGLRAGDTITAVGSTKVTSYEQLEKIIRGSIGKPLVVHYTRKGVAETATITPADGEAYDANGNPIPGSHEGRIGFTSGLLPESRSFATALRRTFPVIGHTLSTTGGVIGHLPGELADIFQGKPRNPATSAVSVVGVVRATGQIGADSGYSQREKIYNLVFTAAQLNLFVGIVNLLPLLPLDGGHIAIVWYEKARAFLARRRRRPDPGRVNILKVLPAAYSVFAVIVVLSVILIYADIANPIKVT